MASIAFGKSKTYPWSSTYWATKTNIRTDGVFSTALGADDGWGILADQTPMVSEDWGDLTGWTNSNSSINPAGQLSQGTSAAYVYDVDFARLEGASYDTTACSWIVVFDTWGTSNGSHVFTFQGQTRRGVCSLSKNGTTLRYRSGAAAWTDTSWVCDSLWHVVTIQNNGSATTLLIDGVVIATNLYNFAYAGDLGLLEIDLNSGQHHIAQLDHISTNAQYQTTDGTLESDPNHAVFDAGSGRQWSSVAFTRDVSNGTVATIDVRCAATAGGLSAASYETIAASGNSIVSKGRIIQIRATLQDASAGIYTPVLKDITVTDENSKCVTSYPMPFLAWSGQG